MEVSKTTTMDSRTVWTVVFANASRVRRNSPKSEQFLRTRERNHKTTVHYCPTVQRKCFRKVMAFTTQSNHYNASNSSFIRNELIITSQRINHQCGHFILIIVSPLSWQFAENSVPLSPITRKSKL